jgi:hypothetical protein
MPLINCDEHGNSPGGMVCHHIAIGSAQIAVRIPPQEGEEGCDYLCEQCVTHPWDLQLEDIEATCMWCARKLTAEMTVMDEEEFRNMEA